MKNLEKNNTHPIKGLKRFFLLGSAFKIFFVIFIFPILIFLILFITNVMLVIFGDIDKVFDIIFLLTIASMPLISSFFAVTFIIWLYFLGTNLFSKLPQDHNMNIRFFKNNIIFIIIANISTNLFFIINAITNFKLIELLDKTMVLPFVIISFCSVFSLFYILKFLSKSLVSVEKQEILKFTDYFGELLFLLFFPVGIWIIQPRINQIFKNTHNNQNIL